MKNNKKIVIITGVTSFLGMSTAKYFISKGFIVFGLVRQSSENMKKIYGINGLNIINIDFNNVKPNDFLFANDLDVSNKLYILKNSNYDITFIHYAWGATLDRSNFMLQMLNIDMSHKVIEFARMLNANRFIFAGSQAEMSDSAYGVAKKQFAENSLNNLMNTNMQFIHLRIFSIYGKEDRDTSLIKTLVELCKSNKDVALSSCNYYWNYLYIDDFVKIIFKMVENNINAGTYDIASNDTRLLKEYVEEARDVLKSTSKLNFGEISDNKEKFAIPDITNMLNAIGQFSFTKFKDGINYISRG